MTSKTLSDSKKIKNSLNHSTIKILFLVSIIVLILIYLKVTSKELYTSVEDIKNYFDKYFDMQSFYQGLNNTLITQSNKINNLGNDVQTVLAGKILSPITTQDPTITQVSTSTQNPNSTKSTTNCSIYTDKSIGLPNECLTEMWKNVGCTNLTDTDNYSSDGLWKKKTKEKVIYDMKEYATLTDYAHRNKCYGPDKTKWPKY